MVSCRARPLRAGAPGGAPSPKAALPPHSRQTRRRSRCSRKTLPPSGSPSPYSISSLLCRHLGQVSEPCRAQVAVEGTKRSRLSPTGALSTLGERFSDARPVSQRVFMSGHELDGELRVAPAAQRLDALLDLGLACRKRGGADQLGAHEAPLLGLHEHQVPAVLQVGRILGLEVAR